MKKLVMINVVIVLFAAFLSNPANVHAAPVAISTQAELETINNDLSADYILTNDIELVGTYSHAVIAYGATAFTGTFDGGGFIIRNLTINCTDNNAGLWGTIGDGGSVSNLGVENAAINAGANAGILAGVVTGGGSISHCYSTGTVTAGNYAGGLVGKTDGPITESYSLADVSGADYVGGLAGYTLAADLISQTYSAGQVTGTGGNVGGLLGKSELLERTSVAFNGNSDYISLTNPLPIFNSSFTVEMWVYFNNDERDILLGDYGMTGGLDVNFEKYTAGALRIYWNGLPSFLTSSSVVEIQKWTHVVYQRDKAANQFRIFVDGALVGTYSGVGDDKVATIPHYFGRDNRTGSTAFNGKMSDVRIWNTVRTTAEIQSDMYQPLTGSESGLVGYWKFDEGTGTTVNDSSASNNDGQAPPSLPVTPDLAVSENDGTINGPTFTSDPNKYFANAMNFDNTDDYIALSKPLPIFSGSFTIEMWAYFNDLNRDILLGDYGLSGAVKINFEKSTNGALRIYWNGGAPDFVTSSNAITTNTWHHIVYQRDKTANKFRIYVDGALAPGGEYTGVGSDRTATVPHYLGRDSRLTYTLNGKMADVRIWNYARTAAEIAADMNHLLVGNETGLLNNWQFDPAAVEYSTINWDTAELQTHSVWDTDTSNQQTSSGGTGQTTTQMQDVNTYIPLGWDFEDVWHFLTSGYPIFSWQTKPADFTNDGDVDVSDLAILAADWTQQSADPSNKSLINPYQNINWATVGQYTSNQHAHSNKSDGADDPNVVIDTYDAYNYDILALTDHDTVTWPWTAYGRDPAALGMIAMKGNEVSGGHHTLSYFSDYDAPSGTLTEAAIIGIGINNGLAVFAHPVYTNHYLGTRGLPAGETWTFEKYAEFYTAYPHLLGMEVYNHITNKDAHRPVWDGVLSLLMPDRNVLGFANDDAHSASARGYSRNVYLLSEFTEQAIRDSMEAGSFYFAYSFTQNGSVPVINSITVDSLAKTITINASNYDQITWISRGDVVATGSVFTLNNEYSYVRAEITGSTGVAFTQPFGITNPCADLIGQGLNYPGDLSGNCKVDLNDFALFAGQWLEQVWN